MIKKEGRTVTERLEEVMEINKETGKSKWWDIGELEKKIGIPLPGNGAAHIQEDRGLGRKYLIEKVYSEEGPHSIEKVRTIGKVHRQPRVTITKKIKDNLPEKCSMCGVSYPLEVDHRDGRGDELYGFQYLCTHCNDLKRSICKICKSTNKRFNATSLGYTKGWVLGAEQFNAYKPRCIGCFWFSPEEFRKYYKGE